MWKLQQLLGYLNRKQYVDLQILLSAVKFSRLVLSGGKVCLTQQWCAPRHQPSQSGNALT